MDKRRKMVKWMRKKGKRPKDEEVNEQGRKKGEWGYPGPTRGKMHKK